MGKYGHQAKSRPNIWEYSFMIAGDSGIGKSTILKEIAERTVGVDGYIALNVGDEDGHSSIRGGIITEDVPDYKTWYAITDDIIKNKDTDYPDLKVLIIDTLDEFISRALEPEAVRQWNLTLSPQDKKATSIKSSWLGFGKGEKKAVEIALNRIKQLEKVGVHVWFSYHMKKTNVIDTVTLASYVQLTANLEKTYFEAFKTKIQLVGVANVDREIVEEKLGRKNIVTHKEETVQRAKSEERRISFRDPAFAIDSKSRFHAIVDEIPMDADAFIKAFYDAIEAYEESVRNNPYNKGRIETAPVKETTQEHEPEAEQDIKEQAVEEVDTEKDTIDENNTGVLQRYDTEQIVADCRAAFKTADTETKKQVKALLNGGKLSEDMDVDVLIDISKLLNVEV